MKKIFKSLIAALMIVSSLFPVTSIDAEEMNTVSIDVNTTKSVELYSDNNIYYYSMDGESHEFNPALTEFILTSNGKEVNDFSLIIHDINEKTTLNIELDQLTVSSSAEGQGCWNHENSAVNANVSLALAGENQITCSNTEPALSIPYSSTYTISGDATSKLSLLSSIAIGAKGTNVEGGNLIINGEPILETNGLLAAEVTDNTQTKTWINHVQNSLNIKQGDLYNLNRNNIWSVKSVNRRSFVLGNGQIIDNNEVKAIAFGDDGSKNIYGDDNCIEIYNLPSNAEATEIVVYKDFLTSYNTDAFNEMHNLKGKNVSVILTNGVAFTLGQQAEITNLIALKGQEKAGKLILNSNSVLSVDQLENVNVQMNLQENPALSIYKNANNVSIQLLDDSTLKENDRIVCLGRTDSPEETPNMKNIRKGITFDYGAFVLEHEAVKVDDYYEHYLVAKKFNAIPIDSDIFPDTAFRAYVLTMFDKNTDDALSLSEIKEVKEINVTNQKIVSLEGIQYFSYLEKLNCGNNQIEVLSLDQNERLQTIDASNNHLTSFYCTSSALLDGQEYTLQLNTTEYNLTDLPGDFNIANATEWKLDKGSGNIEKIVDYEDGKLRNLTDGMVITYTYSYGLNNEYSFKGKLLIKIENSWVKELTVKNHFYGEELQVNAEALYGQVDYLFSASKDGNYTSVEPTKPGTYWVKAVVYNEEDHSIVIESEPKSFLITIPSVSTDDITLKDKDDLTQILSLLNSILQNEQLDESEKLTYSKLKDEISKQVNMLNDVESFIAQVEKFPSIIEPDDIKLKEDLEKLQEKYDLFSDQAKKLISDSTVDKINLLALHSTNYQIESNKQNTWVKGDKQGLTIIANGSHLLFTGLEVDGKAIDASCYTVKAGSTIINLKSTYLSGLNPGQHSLSILYKDGKVSTTFLIVEENSEVPSTGKENMNIIWMTVSFVSFICILLTFKKKKTSKS